MKKLFETLREGFTILEMMVAISIIGILASIVIPYYYSYRNSSYESQAQGELKTIATAAELYFNDHESLPPDANRDLPPGLEAYLGNGNWPNAPWPGSVFDWDAWAPSDLAYPPKQQVYQISIRFCPLGQPTQCKFPTESWAQNFDYYSAVYWCLSGPCRAHSSQPIDHPAYCMNC